MEKFRQGKLFIANFTFGAIPVFSSIVRVHYAVKYGVANLIWVSVPHRVGKVSEKFPVPVEWSPCA